MASLKAEFSLVCGKTRIWRGFKSQKSMHYIADVERVVNGMQVALGTELSAPQQPPRRREPQVYNHMELDSADNLKGRRSRFLPELLHKTQSG